ncbi:MAG: hypothetical protein ACFE7R_03490 [Candidatus Hodarchaeota archaeon]
MNSEIGTAEKEPEEINEVKVANLETRMSNVTISFKVIEKSASREVTSRHDGSINRVSSVIVGDETGIVTLPLWNDRIQDIENGKTYVLKNGYTGLFRGNLRLKIGRESEITEKSDEIENIKMDNDMSEANHGHPRQRHYYQEGSDWFHGRDSNRFRSSYRGKPSRRRRGGSRRRRPRY